MGTSGKGVQVVEMMERRRLEVLCIQETKWKGDSKDDDGRVQATAFRRRWKK